MNKLITFIRNCFTKAIIVLFRNKSIAFLKTSFSFCRWRLSMGILVHLDHCNVVDDGWNWESSHITTITIGLILWQFQLHIYFPIKKYEDNQDINDIIDSWRRKKKSLSKSSISISIRPNQNSKPFGKK